MSKRNRHEKNIHERRVRIKKDKVDLFDIDAELLRADTIANKVLGISDDSDEDGPRTPAWDFGRGALVGTIRPTTLRTSPIPSTSRAEAEEDVWEHYDQPVASDHTIEIVTLSSADEDDCPRTDGINIASPEEQATLLAVDSGPVAIHDKVEEPAVDLLLSNGNDDGPVWRRPGPIEESRWEEQIDPRLRFLGAPSQYSIEHPAYILRRVREEARKITPKNRYPTRSASLVIKEERAIMPDGVIYVLRSTWAAEPWNPITVSRGVQTDVCDPAPQS